MVDKYTVPKHPITFESKSTQPKLQEYPSGKNAEHNFYIDNSFPSMGIAQPAHEGSQSNAPDKDMQ